MRDLGISARPAKLSGLDQKIGFEFVVGSSNISVLALGRWKISGDGAAETRVRGTDRVIDGIAPRGKRLDREGA